MTSASVCLVRALRLMDPSLCGFQGARSDEHSWLSHAVLHQVGVDEVQTSRDLVDTVLGDERDPFDGLRELAKDLVVFRDGFPRCEDPALWQEISHEVDSDLLIAAAVASHRPWAPSGGAMVDELAWPSVLTPTSFAFDSLLRMELVDTHVHLGGALPASFFWIAMMSGFGRLHRLLDWCPEDPYLWMRAVSECMPLRRKLFWRWFRGIERVPSLLGSAREISAREPFVDEILVWLEPDRRRRLRLNPILGERALLVSAFRSLWNPDEDPQRRLSDPNDAWLSPDERRALLLRYLRVRNSFVRYLSHGPGARGLNRFLTTARRHNVIFGDRERRSSQRTVRDSWEGRRSLALERLRFRHALRYQFSDPTDAPWARDSGAGLGRYGGPGDAPEVPFSPWRPARQVEVRVTPRLGLVQARTIGAWLSGLQDFVRDERDAPLLRVGFVFHFLRSIGASPDERQIRWLFDGIFALLDSIPALRPFVVGVDAAGAETFGAPRDLGGFFRYVRDRTSKHPERPGVPPVRLGRTCHVGEDFRDLLTGIRYVDDAVTLMGLSDGDRLGHGLALAIPPTQWYARRRDVHPKFGDHLLDLLWGVHLARLPAHRAGQGPDVVLADAVLHRAREVLRRQESTRLGADLVEEIAAAYDNRERFPSERAVLDALAIPVSLRERILPVRTDGHWIASIEALRRRVISRVVRAEVVIEACPTSNLLVGGFLGYSELPYLNLNRFGLTRSGVEDDPQIPISINSDDPGVFRTTISNEYRLLGAALIDAGYRRRDVLAWLDEARRTGLRSTFIPPWSPPTRTELLSWIERTGLVLPGGAVGI